MSRRYTIEYGDEFLDFQVPNTLSVMEIGLLPIKAEREPEEIIRYALDHPLGTHLERILKLNSQIAIILDDITRPTPTALILAELLPRLNELGVKDEQIHLIFALGTHRVMTKQEIFSKLGENIYEKYKIYQPRYDSPEDYQKIATSSDGQDISLYKPALDCDIRIGIGNIVPHNTLGWSGGGKILFPGVADKESIANFHLRAARSGSVFGNVENPIRHEVEFWVRQIGLDFIINTILTRDMELLDCVAGDPILAHREGVAKAEEVYGVKVHKKSDIVIVNGEPSSFDFWQGTKGLNAANLLVRDNGVVILAIPAREGVGPHDEYLDYLGSEDPDSQLVQKANAKDPIALAVGLMIAKLHKRFSIYVYSDAMSTTQLKRARIKKIESIDACLYTFSNRSNFKTLTIVHNGAEILPIISNPDQHGD